MGRDTIIAGRTSSMSSAGISRRKRDGVANVSTPCRRRCSACVRYSSRLRARDADVAEAPLLLETGRIVERALVRKQAVLHAAEEHQRELEPLRRMQRHELHAVLVGLGLAVAGLEHGEREELGERRQVASTRRA